MKYEEEGPHANESYGWEIDFLVFSLSITLSFQIPALFEICSLLALRSLFILPGEWPVVSSSLPQWLRKNTHFGRLVRLAQKLSKWLTFQIEVSGYGMIWTHSREGVVNFFIRKAWSHCRCLILAKFQLRQCCLPDSFLISCWGQFGTRIFLRSRAAGSMEH